MAQEKPFPMKSIAHVYTKLRLNDLTVFKCADHKYPTISLCVSHDGKFVYSTSKDGTIIKWSISGKKKDLSTSFAQKKMCCLAVDGTGKLLAAGAGNDIYICEPWSLRCTKILYGHRDVVTGIIFSDDSDFLYSIGVDKFVKVWSMRNMCLVETLLGHTAEVMSVDFLFPQTIVTCANDGSIRVWKIDEETHLIFNVRSINICCVRGLNKEVFVCGSEDGQLSLWSLHRKKPMCTVETAHGCNPVNLEPCWIVSVACLFGTDLIASGSYDGFIRVWKIGESFRKISCVVTIPLSGFVNELTFADEGKSIVALIGKEHKLGRWYIVREAKNAVYIINFGLDFAVEKESETKGKCEVFEDVYQIIEEE